MFVGYTLLNVIAILIAYYRLPETFTPAVRIAEVRNGSVITQQLLLLAGIVLITSTSLRALEPILPIYIQDKFTENILYLGLAYVPSALIFGFLQSRLGKVADRVGRKLPIAVGLSVSALSSLLLPSISHLVPLIGLWAMLPLILLWSSEAAAFSAATPAEQALVADISGGKRGRAFGVYTFALSLGQVLGPELGGALYDRDPSLPFYVNTAVLVFGALMMILLIHDPSQRGHDAAKLSSSESSASATKSR
jgi:MFS family permease